MAHTATATSPQARAPALQPSSLGLAARCLLSQEAAGFLVAQLPQLLPMPAPTTALRHAKEAVVVAASNAARERAAPFTPGRNLPPRSGSEGPAGPHAPSYELARRVAGGAYQRHTGVPAARPKISRSQSTGNGRVLRQTISSWQPNHGFYNQIVSTTRKCTNLYFASKTRSGTAVTWEWSDKMKAAGELPD